MADALPGLREALAGRYEIERELGQGGMAVVYLARDLKHHRPVALKVLRPELGVLGPDRFLREVAIAAQLSHPHILPLFDSGEANGLLYYVMPFVPGESLQHRLARERQLPIDDAVSLVRQVAFALAFAHSRDVVHRDIKPANILLHEGEPMVADFGIALAVAAAGPDRLTEVGIAIGTPEYMSPEQAFGDRAVDGRSDVYSLACVLFELLTGEPPYQGPTAQATLTRRLVSPAPSARRLRPTVPLALDQALARALAPDPADRFPSAATFAEALATVGSTRPRSPVVAVLPFLNLSSDPENEYFVDGMTADIIAHLCKVRTLDVISRASVMPFKKREHTVREVAAALNAGTLLDGSVRRIGNRVRIVAQLIDAGNEQQLWAETYDRELDDIFAIQADVALRIAAVLRAELTPAEQSEVRKEPAQNLEAYQRYLQGRHFLMRWTREGMNLAIERFQQAIALDPGYALAHTALAMAHTEQGESGKLPPEHAYAMAREAVARAMAIDDQLADAHCIDAQIRMAWEFDWVGAEQAFKRALALRPGHADTYDLYSRLCSALGRFDESLALVRRAQELDPLAHRADGVTALLRAGRYEEAAEAARRVVAMDPHYDRGHAGLGWALIQLGQLPAGLASLQHALDLSPEDLQWQAQMGQAQAMAGHPERAREILAQLEAQAAERYVSPYHLAYIYTGLGDFESAMDHLEQARAQRSGAIYGIKGSFLFAPLRTHPRFVAMLRTMNLT